MKRSLPVALLIAIAMPACAQTGPGTPDPASASTAPATPGQAPPAPSRPAPKPAPEPLSAADAARYDSCMAGLRDDAVAAGVSAAAFDAQVDGVVPDLSVVELLDAQPAFTTDVWA